MSKMIMSVEEIAHYLGFSTKKIYRLTEDHKIPAIRVGRQYRFVKKVIDEWLKEMSIKHYNKLIIWILGINLLFASVLASSARASRTEVFARATVLSFGTYSFEGTLAGEVRKPGLAELGAVTVKGTYNGPYPWIMRIYTDNINYAGMAGVFGIGNPAGLVSKDAKFTLPLEANCPNWGEDEWLRIPDLNDPNYIEYSPPSEVAAGIYSDRIITGIDPRNADWVSGPDRILFTPDDNFLGDITLETPFEIKFRTKVEPNTPIGDYVGRIYIEIVPAP